MRLLAKRYCTETYGHDIFVSLRQYIIAKFYTENLDTQMSASNNSSVGIK